MSTLYAPPSYGFGYARRAAESEYPELWRGLVGAWVPALGITGSMIPDISGRSRHGIAAGGPPVTDWRTTSFGPLFGCYNSNWFSPGTLGSFLLDSYSTGMTVLAVIRCGTVTTSRLAIAGSFNASIANSLHLLLNGNGIGGVLAGAIEFGVFVQSASDAQRFITNALLANGANNVIALSVPPTLAPAGAKVVINNTRAAITAIDTTTNPITAGFTNPLYIGARNNNGTADSYFNSGGVSMLALWTAEKSLDCISADPFAPFRLRRRVYAVASGEAPPATNRRRRILIGA